MFKTRNIIFSPRERQVFCEVYNNKCYYCAQYIHPHNTELDHIIPQSTSNLEELKKQFLLLEDFNIHGYENILPCCGHCNKRKGNSVYPVATALMLELAKNNKKLIATKVEKLNRIHEKSKDKECTIPFILEFRDEIRKYYVNKSILVDFEKIPIKTLSSDINYLTLYNEEDAEIQVTNILEYREAIKNGYFAKTMFDMKNESSFTEMNSILYTLEVAKFPNICWFSNQDFHLNNIDLIDSSIANNFIKIQGSFLEPEPTSKSISKLIDSNEITLIKRDKQHLHFTCDSYGKKIKELLRGDFTGNGYEEILCSVYEYSIEGTFGILYMIRLEKLELNSLAYAKLIFY